MAAAIFLAWTNPAPGVSEEEVNDWYDNVHIPQIRAAVPSIRATTRYRTAPFSQGSEPGQTVYAFLAVYELDSADVVAVAQDLDQAVRDGAISMGSVLELAQTPPVMQFYTGVAP